MKQESQDLFFELLKMQGGAQKTLSRHYTDEQWLGALDIANEQAITGVLVAAMETVEDKSFLPNKPVLLQWIGHGTMIEQTSFKIEEAGKAVIRYFRDNGFACQILKGSAVARYYPKPYSRSSGDIDVWAEGGRKKIYDYARNFDKDGKLYGVNYHHIHFHLIDGVHIEVHIWPSFLSSPLRNSRLHTFCNMYRPTMESDMPCLAFDRVFILLHCYRHICGDGVGLRQIMDYYYVLKQGFNENEKTEAIYWVGKLGMTRFARGLMWVLQEYLGLDNNLLLFDPDEKEGRFIMQEVMQTGNMGHSDSRDWGSKGTAFSRFALNLRRDVYLAKHYPHESLWQPFFSIWLFVWRLSNGLLKDRDDD